MTTGRILQFTPRAMPRESLSPFRQLMPQRSLSSREVLHRRRMLGAFVGGYRLRSLENKKGG